MTTRQERIVAIIPARYHSNRFPGKPLAPICGKPMILHVAQRAAQASGLDAVVVATDDERIARTVEDAGVTAVMTRPDHVSGTDRLAEAAALLGLGDDDIVVNIQGDQPLFPPQVIGELTAPMLADAALPMATLIYRIVRPEEIDDPNHVKTVFDHRGNALYFSRAPIPFQRSPEESGTPTYYKHLGFYAYRKHFLATFVSLPEGAWERFEKLEQLRALEYGYPIRVVETGYDSIEVDRPEDVARVEQVLQGG